ncbi:hypothetical protein [Candidatus Venteria ishoeyi]|uniref:Uncharacterized protein n=1 Tax=Candidatus Venteria ishoeyi TaxID=1899563 RepID=A0A1H6FD44_9GAMM|nr:hypothetical protein [Candidatus Venteria ishoeyi]MDM8546425.1 hypothetical protein [Candidatus Venteria ishoeyi]SEH07563.1 Uncharacterised protein [Candidatus Venteria ishoeyi]
MKRFILMIFGLLLIQPALSYAFVAGSQPYQRPANAPRIQQYVRSPAWYQQALQGVSQPYPASLSFIQYQGAWYTPFTRPGMTGPYDLRGWHVKK